MFMILTVCFFTMTFETQPRDTVLVPLRSVIPDLLTDVRYATADNFTKRVLYPIDTLYARRVVAESLAVAQRSANARGLQLKVYDAYRPLSVQRLMWSLVPDERYVADPAKGSRHNRGCALDLTLCDSTGRELDMGTGYDEFTERAAATFVDLDESVLQNRRLLQSIMSDAGFDVLPSEWWHYDLRGWERFEILNE
ncbi:MAG: D-alanyl-D-alanine dipeptidase [Candidatus Kapabacteria bacterium]|nr:D-alanyl-D-alanine dipeptidase [Candidatus Kapabacteria bacterium]